MLALHVKGRITNNAPALVAQNACDTISAAEFIPCICKSGVAVCLQPTNVLHYMIDRWDQLVEHPCNNNSFKKIIILLTDVCMLPMWMFYRGFCY